MSDNTTFALVKSTLPAIAAAGPKVTEYFYQRMLREHPELKNVFNMSHQIDGQQPRALFSALCAYGANLESVEMLLPAVEKIAQKHVSLTITADQYQIVGENLLATIRELLDPGEDVIAAWAEVYQQLATIFIHREEQLYEEHQHQPGGWRGTRRFVISDILPQSEQVKSFELTPQDQGPIAAFQPGQFTSVYLQPEQFEYRQIRQYSLTGDTKANSYRIAVRHYTDGQVSNWLHTVAKIGDVIELSPPSGNFTLSLPEQAAPIYFISAGIGLTPLLPMLKTLAAQHYAAPVNWFAAYDRIETRPFAAEIANCASQLPQFNSALWLKENTDTTAHHQGLMDLTDLADGSINPQGEYYLCGPYPFMQMIAKQLAGLGVEATQIHYELFGPDQAL